MRFIADDEDSEYARWVLEAAQLRALARRQLAFGIPIVIAGIFVAIVSTFSFAHTSLTTPDRQPASTGHRHTTMLG